MAGGTTAGASDIHRFIVECIYTSREGKTITDSITNLAAPAGTLPYPADAARESSLELRRWFLNLFPFRLSSAVKRGENGKWLDVSRYHYLTDEEIFDAIQPQSKLQRGFRFDETTMFLVVSIPSSSQYHNAESISDLRNVMYRDLAVSPRHYQSDEDWYLYIFLSAPVRADQFTAELKKWFKSRSFVVEPNTLEIHPADKPVPFPLQNRFAWLNDKCQLLVRRSELSTEDALGFFLEDAGKNSVDPNILLDLLKELNTHATIEVDQTVSLIEESAAEVFEPEHNPVVVDNVLVLPFGDVAASVKEEVASELEVCETQLVVFQERSESDSFVGNSSSDSETVQQAAAEAAVSEGTAESAKGQLLLFRVPDAAESLESSEEPVPARKKTGNAKSELTRNETTQD